MGRGLTHMPGPSVAERPAAERPGTDGDRTFAILCTAAGTLYAALALVLYAFPGIVYWLFDMVPHVSADTMSGRAAALFAGLAILTVLARDEPTSRLRRKFCIASAAIMIGLAIVGAIDFAQARVGAGIAVAIMVELAIAAAFIRSATAGGTGATPFR